MTTIIIAQDITATLTNRKAEQYFKALEASESSRLAMKNDELDWVDLEEFWMEEADAWEEFFF